MATDKSTEDRKGTAYLLEHDPDFVLAPRHGNSLAAVIDDLGEIVAPKGADPALVPRAAARMLRMTQEQAGELRDQALEKLRGEVKVSDR